MRDLFLVGVTLLLIGVVGLFFMGFQGKAFSFKSLWGDVDAFEEKASFDSEEIKQIHVDVSSTDVQLLRSDSDEIVVRYYGESNNANKMKESFYAKTTGPSLKVGKKSTVNFGVQFNSDQLEISLPDKLWDGLYISSSSGDINGRGVKVNAINLKLSSGDIGLTDIQAEKLTVNTSSGSFEGENINAEISAQTSSGDVELSRQPFPHNMDIRSSSGDVSIQTNETPSNLYLQFDSSSGEAEIDFPMQFTSMDESHVKGTVGEGEYKIEVKTSSGDFEFTK